MSKVVLSSQAKSVLIYLEEERNKICKDDSYALETKALTFSINMINELIKLEEEINRCYVLANYSFESGMDREYYLWMDRANAFRDAKAIVEEKLLTIADIKEWTQTITI